MLLQEFAILFAFVFLVDLIYFFIRLRRYQKTKEFILKAELLKFIFISYLAAIVAVLLLPKISLGIDDDSGFFFHFIIPPSSYNLRPFQTIFEQLALFQDGNPIGVINLFVNSCIFAPLPVLLYLNNPKRKMSACFFLSFAAIVACECLQYFVGRAADIDDVILNTAGVLIGILFFQLLRHIWAAKVRKH